MESKQIALSNKTFTLETARAKPRLFLAAVEGTIPPQTFAQRKKESTEQYITRLFNRCLRSDQLAKRNKVTTEKRVSQRKSETEPAPIKSVKKGEIKINISQTPNVLANNARDLSVDIIARLSDILLHSLYVPDGEKTPAELLEALTNLNAAARIVKATAENVIK